MSNIIGGANRLYGTNGQPLQTNPDNTSSTFLSHDQETSDYLAINGGNNPATEADNTQLDQYFTIGGGEKADSNGNGSFKSQQGFGGYLNYNHGGDNQNITANTWTTILNDGQGAFNSLDNHPDGIDTMLDTTTGKLDFRALRIGDSILIRNDFSLTPVENNASVQLRYSLGTGFGSYTLSKNLGRMDNGSGISYRFSLATDLIFMGDANTRDNGAYIQIHVSTDSVLNNSGTVIQVLRR